MLRANASTDKFITKNKQFNEKCLLTTIIFFICGLLMKVILRSKYLLLSATGQCHASPREFRYVWPFKGSETGEESVFNMASTNTKKQSTKLNSGICSIGGIK